MPEPKPPRVSTHTINPNNEHFNTFFFYQDILGEIESLQASNKLVLEKKDILLDLGCGENEMARAFVKDGYVNAKGIDISKENGKAPDVVARIENLSAHFPPESVKVITCISLFDEKIYDLQNQTLMLEEIFRVLAKGAIFFSISNTISCPVPSGLKLLKERSSNWMAVYQKQ